MPQVVDDVASLVGTTQRADGQTQLVGISNGNVVVGFSRLQDP